MEGCKLRFAETDKPEWGLVTRDYALVFFFCIPKTSKRAKKTKTDIFGNFFDLKVDFVELNLQSVALHLVF